MFIIYVTLIYENKMHEACKYALHFIFGGNAWFVSMEKISIFDLIL